MVHLIAVGGDAGDAVLVEGTQRIRQQARRLQEVVNQHRHEYVQFKVALRRGEADRGVVAHHLHRNHGHGFALGGVDLAGHDRGAGLVLGNVNLAQTVARAARQPAHVVGDLHHVAGQSLECAVREYQIVL